MVSAKRAAKATKEPNPSAIETKSSESVVLVNWSRASSLSFAITNESNGPRCQNSRKVKSGVVWVLEVEGADLGRSLSDYVGVEIPNLFVNRRNLPLSMAQRPELLFKSANKELATVELGQGWCVE